MNDQHLLELARTAGCTRKQLQALELKARGYGNHRISTILGISRQSVNDRLAAAYRKMQNVKAA